MEEKLNCFLLLPLREVALRRIAVVLVNKSDFLPTTENFPLEKVDSYRRQWIETAGKQIDDTVSKLPLPPSLQKEMVPILKAVGSEILKWKLRHKVYLGEIGLHVVEKLVWTTAGTVDYRKTAQSLVDSDVLDSRQRFELACLYCLEDCIPALWNELSERNRKTFCYGRHPSQVDIPNLQLFLPYILKKSAWGDCCPLISFRRDCFTHSSVLGNKTAAEYSFNRLSKQKRKVPLTATTLEVIQIRNLIGVLGFEASHETLPDVLCYLLSLMTHEEQVFILKELPEESLRVFFDWPWQDLCLEIADVVWTFFPEDEYRNLLWQIKAHIRRSGFYLPSFIQEFFLRSPVKFRQCLLDEECENVFFFTEFFHAEDFESIRVIFKNTDAADIERLLFSREFLTLCGDFFLQDKSFIVDKCIQEAMLTEEVRNRLKKAFETSGISRDFEVKLAFEQSYSRAKRFCEFLDPMNENTEEQKNTVNENISPVKKLSSGGGNDSLPSNDGIFKLTAGKSTEDETLAQMKRICNKKENDTLSFLDEEDKSTEGKRSAEDEAPSQVKKICNEK